VRELFAPGTMSPRELLSSVNTDCDDNTASTSSLPSKNIDQLGLHSPTYPKQKLNSSIETTFDNTAELSEQEDDLNSSASLAEAEDSKTASNSTQSPLPLD